MKQIVSIISRWQSRQRLLGKKRIRILTFQDFLLNKQNKHQLMRQFGVEKLTILSIWSATPSHHFLISLRNSFFGLASSSDPSLFPRSVSGMLALSVSRTIWSRGTFNSKISLIVDRANDTSTDAVEKCLTIFSLEAERSGEFSLDGVVWSQRKGLKVEIVDE